MSKRKVTIKKLAFIIAVGAIYVGLLAIIVLQASDIAKLTTQVDNLTRIVRLKENQTILYNHYVNQGPNSITQIASFCPDYAGYLDISLTSTSSST